MNQAILGASLRGMGSPHPGGMTLAELERYEERVRGDRLRSLKRQYVDGSISVSEFEQRAWRALTGPLHEPTDKDRALARALLERRRRG